VLLDKLSSYGVSIGNINWLCTYTVDITTFVSLKFFRFLSLHSLLLWPSEYLFFIIYMNDLCSRITSCNFLLFADINIFRPITFTIDCFLLQSDAMCKIDALKIIWKIMAIEQVISFTRKPNTLIFKYDICNSDILRTEFIKHIQTLFPSACWWLLPSYHPHKAVRPDTGYYFFMFSIDSLIMFYCNLVRSVVEQVSVVWNSLSDTWLQEIWNYSENVC
jgi:hypothetical protein